MTCLQYLVKIFKILLNILSEEKRLTSVKGCDSVKILRTMTGNNLKPDVVNYDELTKFGQILSINSEDNERAKKTFVVSQGL